MPVPDLCYTVTASHRFLWPHALWLRKTGSGTSKTRSQTRIFGPGVLRKVPRMNFTKVWGSAVDLFRSRQLREDQPAIFVVTTH